MRLYHGELELQLPTADHARYTWQYFRHDVVGSGCLNQCIQIKCVEAPTPLALTIPLKRKPPKTTEDCPLTETLLPWQATVTYAKS